LKQNLCSKDLLAQALDRAGRALKSGHSVWIVGSLPPPTPGEILPQDLPPAPVGAEPFGYEKGCACGYIWGRQMAHFLDTHSESTQPIRLEPTTGVIPDEDLPVLRAAGWHEPHATPAPL
jgi:hypothetical protein